MRTGVAIRFRVTHAFRVLVIASSRSWSLADKKSALKERILRRGAVTNKRGPSRAGVAFATRFASGGIKNLS